MYKDVEFPEISMPKILYLLSQNHDKQHVGVRGKVWYSLKQNLHHLNARWPQVDCLMKRSVAFAENTNIFLFIPRKEFAMENTSLLRLQCKVYFFNETSRTEIWERPTEQNKILKTLQNMLVTVFI